MIKKVCFTTNAAIKIREVLQKLQYASSQEKKKFRRILRVNYGFYISAFDDSGKGFTTMMFDHLIRAGLIQISKTNISHEAKGTFLKTNENNTNASAQDVIVPIESNEKHKLEAIAEIVVSNLNRMYNIRPIYFLEYKPLWLTDFPSEIVLNKFKNVILDVYFKLTNKKLSLNQSSILNNNGQQSFDIWISEPFNFAVEFDESQHFNQFRLTTLSCYPDIRLGFNIKHYKTLCDKVIKPSTSRFCKLKHPNPLFPEFLPGIEQDNRIRQRAFRDFLKDLIPVANGLNNTIRIPYHIVHKKIKGFTELDLQHIEYYLTRNGFLSTLI